MEVQNIITLRYIKKKNLKKKDYIEKSSATSVKNLENGRFYPCKNKYLKHIYI